jgi:hypothetical protein
LLTFNTQEPDFTPIDVTTGYKAHLVVYSLAQPDRAGNLAKFVDTDFVYDNGFITLQLLEGDINAIHSGTYGYQVNISDDSFSVANAMIGAGQFQVVPSAFAV